MKLTIVVQRYGATIVGGAEALARTIARSLAECHEVTVATTTASDYETWRNDLASGEDSDGPIRVLRFPVERERTRYWHQLNRILHGPVGGAEFSALSPATKESFRQRIEKWPLGLQEEYIRWQGPYAPGLFQWLRGNGASQDHFLFFTYLYPTTYFGMPCVPQEKVDFYPTLHDELPAYLPAFARCFRLPTRIFFSTETERHLAQRLYRVAPEVGEILGYGIEDPPATPGKSLDDKLFLLFAGRVDVNKGIPSLLQYFLRWKEEHPHSPLQLILIGKSFLDLPRHSAIDYRGFVSEEEKGSLMRQAVALINPSPYESLGIIILEAFLCGTPVLVLGKNEVLVDHCRLSNGGLWYDDYHEFAEALSWLLDHPKDAKRLGEQGRAYAQTHYGMASYRKRLAALYPPDSQENISSQLP